MFTLLSLTTAIKLAFFWSIVREKVTSENFVWIGREPDRVE